MVGLFRWRHSWLRSVVACCLLILAASPCTAPFSTFDLLPSAPAAPPDAAKTKTSNDDVVAVSGVALTFPIPAAPPAPTLDAPADRHPRASHHTVLRL